MSIFLKHKLTTNKTIPLPLLVVATLLFALLLSCDSGKENTAKNTTESTNAKPMPTNTTTQAMGIAALNFAATTNPINPNSPLTILFLGDSLTEGFRLQQQYSYPSVVGKTLASKGVSNKIINAGVNGDTSSGGLVRLKWQLQNNIKPHIVVVALGANDGLRGLSTENLEKNLVSIVQLAKKSGAHIILAGMQIPLNYGKAYVQNFKSVYTNIAREQQVALIPFLLSGVAGEAKYNLDDGIHPNSDGYILVANNVLTALEPLATKVARKMGNTVAK